MTFRVYDNHKHKFNRTKYYNALMSWKAEMSAGLKSSDTDKKADEHTATQACKHMCVHIQIPLMLVSA